MRFGGLFNKSRKDRELQDELVSHIQMHVEDNLRSGMTPEEARRQAMIRMGGIESAKEAYRAQRGLPLLETLFQDVRFGLRMLRKNPGFVAVAVLTLALGIGANTAIFSIVDQLLARPLPVARPQRLALVAHGQRGNRLEFDFTYSLFRDYQRENTVFSLLAVTMDESVGLGAGGTTERRRALLVSGNYFAMLGIDAALGRTFAPNEGVEIDDAPVVILSHRLWQGGFGADPQVIGRKVTVNSRSFTVIGVAPREFAGTTRGLAPDLYLPITMYGQLTSIRPGGENPLASRYYSRPWMMGRLKDGVNPAQAEAALGALAQRAYAAGIPNASTNLIVLPGSRGFDQDLADTRLPLNLLLGTALLVLLIACANLANLQVARASGRARDFAIRLALGAGRARVVRELLTESTLLALGGGALGMVVAVWLGDVLGRFRPPNIDIDVTAGLEPRVLLFAFGASVVTGILFGLAPAFRASRPQIIPELKDGGGKTELRGADAGISAARWSFYRSRCRSWCWPAPACASAVSRNSSKWIRATSLPRLS